jgi:putative endonuclease
MGRGWMYILECADESYYTGSTINPELRLSRHQNGEGPNLTKKKITGKTGFFEKYQRIEKNFYREKQVQGRSRKKKEALKKRNARRTSQTCRVYE